MKKLVLSFFLSIAFLLPSTMNACQGTLTAVDTAEADAMEAQGEANCNSGDWFMIHDLSTGETRAVVIW